MKKAKDGETNFFVDEFGDPVFYNKRGKLIVGSEGCSLHLGLGFVEVSDPETMRQAILGLQREIVSDPYLNKISSVRHHTSVAFHASQDTPEVRMLMFKLIATMDFTSHFVVSCKSEKIFKELFNSNENEYYDGMVSRLFRDVLHRVKHNRICFSSRGSRNRRRPLELAILNAKKKFEDQCNMQVQGCTFEALEQSSKGEPCLSVVDYVAWAVQRAYHSGESRYYDYVRSKIKFVLDLREEGTTRYYGRYHPLDINKIARLQLGS